MKSTTTVGAVVAGLTVRQVQAAWPQTPFTNLFPGLTSPAPVTAPVTPAAPVTAPDVNAVSPIAPISITLPGPAPIVTLPDLTAALAGALTNAVPILLDGGPAADSLTDAITTLVPSFEGIDPIDLPQAITDIFPTLDTVAPEELTTTVVDLIPGIEDLSLEDLPLAITDLIPTTFEDVAPTSLVPTLTDLIPNAEQLSFGDLPVTLQDLIPIEDPTTSLLDIPGLDSILLEILGLTVPEGIPEIGLPPLPELPDLETPELEPEIPDLDIADIIDFLGNGIPELEDIDVPEIDTPEIEAPELPEIPDDFDLEAVLEQLTGVMEGLFDITNTGDIDIINDQVPDLTFELDDILQGVTSVAPGLTTPELFPDFNLPDVIVIQDELDLCFTLQNFITQTTDVIGHIAGEDGLLDLPVVNVLGDLLRSVSDQVEGLANGLVQSVPICEADVAGPLSNLGSLLDTCFAALGKLGEIA